MWMRSWKPIKGIINNDNDNDDDNIWTSLKASLNILKETFRPHLVVCTTEVLGDTTLAET